MPTDLQKARELFLHAVGKLPPEEWDGYVADACGGDAELAQQVEGLLKVHREAGSFLDRPAAAVGMTGVFTPEPGAGAVALFLPEKAGTMIGPYKLLQQIGEGGMGVVWMAEQAEPIQRKVALKVIKPGMDSRQVIARFEAERQALALMDHVNIARVFDGGTTGEPDAQARDGEKPLACASGSGRPYFVMELVHGVPITKYCDDNHLTPRQRLELFVPVCQAIQHAHQKGIIHRDIKPSNVMVTLYDGKPVPKVIDFGVAKATEQKLTERTLFTQFGTMVGTLEYMSPEQAEMSALGVDTRSDIYSLGVLLYELLTGSTPLTRQRMKEAAYAEILRMIKEEEPPKPSTRLSDSGEALASISANRHTEPAKLTKLVKGELDWIVMKTLEKDRNRRYETASAFAADVQRYLNDEPVQACPPSSWYRFRKFARRHKWVLASVACLGLLLLIGMGGIAVSNDLIRQERDEKEAALEAKGKALLVAEINFNKAEEQRKEAGERLKENEAIFRYLVEEMLLSAAPEHAMGRPLTVAEVLANAERQIDTLKGQPRIECAVRNTLGHTYLQLGRYEPAEMHFRRIHDVWSGIPGADPAGVLSALSSLGIVYSRQGKLDKAREALQQSCKGYERLASEHPEALIPMSNLAMVFFQQGERQKALLQCRKTSALCQNLRGGDTRERLVARTNLATVLEAIDELQEARQLFDELIPLRLRASGEDHPETLTLLSNFAVLLRKDGKLKEAREYNEKVLALRQKILGPDHPYTFHSMNNLANVLSDQGHLDEARRQLEQVLKLRIDHQGKGHPDTLLTMANLANVLERQKQRKQAHGLREEALAIAMKEFHREDLFALSLKKEIARGLVQGKDYDRAQPLLEEVRTGYMNVRGERHPDTLEARFKRLTFFRKGVGMKTPASFTN
jgi:eukaryotic-like serine/threonine-protein kinase